MSDISRYHMEALINGAVNVTPNLLRMRKNDENTPGIDVFVSYDTADGRRRPFSLVDKEILFETRTPGGGAGVFSSKSSPYFVIEDYSQGHFIFMLPAECKDAIGSSAMAYFRFIQGDNIFSTGDFTYTVVKDLHSLSTSELKPPANYYVEFKVMQKNLADMEEKTRLAKTAADEAVRLSDENRNGLLKKQNTVPAAANGNIVIWQAGSTVDGGINSAQVGIAVDNAHRHDNFATLNKIGGTEGKLLYQGNALMYEREFSPVLIDFPIEHLLNAYPKALVLVPDVESGGEAYKEIKCVALYPDRNNIKLKVFYELNTENFYGVGGYGDEGYGGTVREPTITRNEFGEFILTLPDAAFKVVLFEPLTTA